ncbi:MAG: zinc dependent phospholipase C family protein [Oscillospiraceae bacterium]|jgi:hypothetical protein
MAYRLIPAADSQAGRKNRRFKKRDVSVKEEQILKTKSHELLGKFLIDGLFVLPAPKHEKAFKMGCVGPDYNYLTYIKCSRKLQLFRGHNSINTKSFIRRTIGRLQKSRRWGMLHYYRLGKLIHYVSDSFTYAHNERFGNKISEHRQYELKLQAFFSDYILKQQSMLLRLGEQNLEETISLIHKQYLKTKAGILTDARYIFVAAGLVFNQLIPEARAGQACRAAI